MTLLATIDWYAFLFLVFAALACGFAAAVLFTSNIVRMAFYLTLSLGATAGLFFLAGAEFIGAMQLMIYVGGTLVLLIFGVMLTAQAPFVAMRTRSGEWVTAVIAGGAMLFLLIAGALGVRDWQTARVGGPLPLAEAQTATAVGAGLAGVRVDRLNVAPDESSEAVLENTYAGYLLPFVIISVHLLVVLVGAAYLARPKARRPDVSEVPAP